MSDRDTVAAIAVSSKEGSISILRMSGRRSLEIASSIFYGKDGSEKDLSRCASHTVHYGLVGADEDHMIDEVLILIMRGPRSYTAEDVVEIQCHGGRMVCQLILELLINKGAAIAEPGEFTRRAFMNGRIDLSQAESVMDLIRAKSDMAVRNSVAQLRGSVKEKVKDLRKVLLEDLAFLEAALDDPEHIPLDDFSSLVDEHACTLKEELEHLLKNSQNGRVIKEGIRTAIVGKPNVGKSSFLNCILREERAIVTEIPGTTRDTLEEEVRIGSVLLHLVDTAGIRKTEDRIESMGVEKAKRAIEQADFVICILDSGRTLEEEDLYVLRQAEDCPGVILCNKSDIPPVLDPHAIPETKNKKIFSFSSHTGEGLERLEQYIHELFIQDGMHYNDEIYITNARQKELLADALEGICRLQDTIGAGMPEDLYSIDLMSAYVSLGKIIGETVEDDVADKVFRDFCMGK